MGCTLTRTCCLAQAAVTALHLPASPTLSYRRTRQGSTPQCCVLIIIKTECQRRVHDLSDRLCLQLLLRYISCDTAHSEPGQLLLCRLSALQHGQLLARFILQHAYTQKYLLAGTGKKKEARPGKHLESLHQDSSVDFRERTAGCMRAAYCHRKEKDRNLKNERDYCFNFE